MSKAPYVIAATALSAAASVVLAAPASADEASYLYNLQPQFAYLTPQQLVSAAHTSCSITKGGSSATAIPAVQKQLGVSVPTAYEIVAAATVHFGC